MLGYYGYVKMQYYKTYNDVTISDVILDEGMGILMPLFILTQMDFIPGAIA